VLLAEIVGDLNAHLIYISTDAVFDGRQGNYSEADETTPPMYTGVSFRASVRCWRGTPRSDRSINTGGWNAQRS
jgi:hypothetical protein